MKRLPITGGLTTAALLLAGCRQQPSGVPRATEGAKKAQATGSRAGKKGMPSPEDVVHQTLVKLWEDEVAGPGVVIMPSESLHTHVWAAVANADSVLLLTALSRNEAFESKPDGTPVRNTKVTLWEGKRGAPLTPRSSGFSLKWEARETSGSIGSTGRLQPGKEFTVLLKDDRDAVIYSEREQTYRGKSAQRVAYPPTPLSLRPPGR
jgi:hypothetical protein